MRNPKAWLALVPLAALVGCSDPTLEEACEEYCAAANDTHCGGPQPDECTTGCDNLRQDLENEGMGECIDEMTNALDCTADGEFTCYEGIPVPTGTDCADEAQDLAACMGLTD